MSAMTFEQLMELTELCNAAIDEFGGRVEPVTAGHVRLILARADEWRAKQDTTRTPTDPVAGDPLMDHYWAGDARGYERGFAKGYVSARQEVGIFETQPDHERLMTMSAPADERAPVSAGDDNIHRLEAEDKRLGPYGEPLGAEDNWDEGNEREQYQDGFGAPMTGERGPTDEGMGLAMMGDVARVTAQRLAKSAPEPEPVTPILSPEALSPLVPRRPRTLADVDSATIADDADELASTRMSKDDKAAQLREALAYLQDNSPDGLMPSMTTYDKQKPAHLPTAKALLGRHDLTWTKLADYAKLKFSMGPPSGTRKPRAHDGGGGMDE